jgi:mannose-6-phosphate isomerase-like protein (cupin superfamily)
MSKKVQRTWGWFCNLDENDHSMYKIKKICIYPGKRVSLQSHNERNEHWVFLKGESKVYLNNSIYMLHENDYIYIPKNSQHSIENIGSENMELVQTLYGKYLGEDDIVRHDDDDFYRK